MPLRHRLRNFIVELDRIRVTLFFIAGELSRSMRRRVSRSLAGDRSLRIGVDIRPFYEPLTGVGWYLFYLLEQFARRSDVELVLFGDPLVTDNGPRLFVSLPAATRTVGIDLRGRPVPRFARKLSSGVYLLMTMIEGCDVTFGANYFLPRALSATARKRVITIHDLTYRRHPELLQEETLDNLEREMLREIARADAIICVSESTRQDVLREYSVDPSKVVTIHSGIRISSPESLVPGPKPVRKRTRDQGPGTRDLRGTSLPDHYILFVSTIEPRKNLETLVSAFEMLRDEERYEGDLIAVGRIGWKTDISVSRMTTSRWRARIHHLDYVNQDQLGDIYRSADVFVLPSIYEGFGFPILEAMAHGVPVVAARSSSLPEVGGDAALYFDPKEPRQLAGAIVDAIKRRNELVRKGRARVAAFPWEKAAEETLAVFRRVAESG